MTNQLTEIFVELVTALIGTLGFALIFRIRFKHLPVVAVGGMLTDLVYLSATLAGASLLLSAVLSALFMGLFSEIAARLLKAPVAVFLLPCAIPIVPGSYLYYSMFYLLTQNNLLFRSNLFGALEIGVGIALGTSISTVCVGLFFFFKAKAKNKIQ